MLTYKDFVSENRKRRNTYTQLYDPVTGEGSTSVARTHVFIHDFPIRNMWLPLDFANTPLVQNLVRLGMDGYIETFCHIKPSHDARTTLFIEFCRARHRYDFEFWAITCATISIKGKGCDSPFRLNTAQRKFLEELESLRMADKPISIILLKARQWGGSTLTQIYMLWIQIIHRHNWNSVICGHVENTSRIVSGMLQKVISNYPVAFSGTQLKTAPYERAQSTRVINISNSRYSIGSAEKPDKLRGEDVSMVHLTEVGLWKPTKTKSPEDIVQSILGSLNSGPYTVLVIESTAKGVGNFFHRTWLDAVSGRGGLKPVFISWFIIEGYATHVPDDKLKEFYQSMTDYEWKLFSMGASVDNLQWYRDKMKEPGFKDNQWRMCSEYPSFPEEAFQSTGRRVFKMAYVESARAECMSPAFMGDFVADSDTGEAALHNIRFVKHISGTQKNDTQNCLKVWSMPDDSEPYSDRYIVMADTGAGMTDMADFTEIKVADRLPMLTGGVPEIVAEWHGRIEPDKIAWKAAQIAEAYNHALLVIESNKMEADRTEGENFEFILNELGGVYDNLYSRTSEEMIRQGKPRKYGFHTNISTKPMVIKFLNKALRDQLYIERDEETCYEMDLFELKEDGKTMGAVEGNHDDRVMATAILIWICYNWPLPTPKARPKTYVRKIVSEASM